MIDVNKLVIDLKINVSISPLLEIYISWSLAQCTLLVREKLLTSSFLYIKIVGAQGA